MVPVPGVRDGWAEHDGWVVHVVPSTGVPALMPVPPSPFSGGVPLSPFVSGTMGPVVRCADVLHALFVTLQRRATEQEYYSLGESRRARVSSAFWTRCRASGPEATVQAEVQFGVKRIDFLEGRTRWVACSRALSLLTRPAFV